MTADRQHSRSSSPTSNRRALEAWKLLGVACREVAGATLDGDAVERVVSLALAATGAERAFVVSSVDGGSGGPARIHLSLSRRRDGERLPSKTVLSRSLAARRVWICGDAATDPRLASGASVRSLGLRVVLSAPVPFPALRRAALVLDGRLELLPRRGETRELLQGFAALVGLALGGRIPAPHGTDRGLASEPDLVGDSPTFRDLLARTRRVAPWPLPVLVTGESGSGKEGIARTLHWASPRRRGPFVAVNCAAITETLLESELFGAVRGAYTGLERDRPGLFKLAHGGTLLLDEVGDMSGAMQAKLLRVLQDGRIRPVGGEVEEPVDVRVVAATHRNLGERVEQGRFRQDLYFRIAVVRLHAPPLRERRGDIPLLARHLGAGLARRIGIDHPEWTSEALERLEGHGWPGNVRELEAVVARALLHSGGAPIRARHVDLPHGARSRVSASDGLEARMIEGALRESGGVTSRAAAAIGWSRQKLTRRMTALGIARGET